MHSATSAVGANELGQETIIVFGGIGNNRLVSNTVYEYNTEINTLPIQGANENITRFKFFNRKTLKKSVSLF